MVTSLIALVRCMDRSVELQNINIINFLRTPNIDYVKQSVFWGLQVCFRVH